MNIISTKKVLIGIIVLGVFLKLMVMIMTQSWKFESDFHFAYEAGEIGASLAMGKGYSWLTEKKHHQSKANESTAWEAPVYPFIIAAVFKVFGIYSNTSAVVLICFQIFISAMICIVLFLIGRHVFNDFTGILTALLFILNPSSMHFIIQKIYNTPLYILFLLLFIYQLLKIAEFPSYKASLVAGVICGMSILTAPFIISFLPFALGWLFFKIKAELKTRIIITTLLFLALCVAISPWQIRNYIVFDKFILVRSNLGRELFLGNFGPRKLDSSDRKILRSVNEGERDKLYGKRFIEFVRNDPRHFAKEVYRRVKLFWTAMPRTGGPWSRKTGNVSEQILGVYYLFILILGFLGLCITIFKNKGSQILFLCLLSLPIPFYFTWFTRFRYRFPVEIILIIFSSYAIYYSWTMMKGKWSKETE